MRECKRHSSESQPEGGVCASCLRERLDWLWRGEGFRGADPENPLPDPEDLPAHGRDDALLGSQPEGAASAARERNLDVDGVATGRILPQISTDRVHGSDPSMIGDLGLSAEDSRSSGDAAFGNDPTDLAATPRQSSQTGDIVAEWTAFHARRRRNLGRELDSAKSRSLDSLEVGPLVDVLMASDNARRGSLERSPQLSVLMSAQKLRTRSMPLDNRSAEDTASRVIREEADELYTDDLDVLQESLQSDRDEGGGGVEQRNCFSPAWQTRKSKPKWLRVLLSPLTSRNKVFPSRSKEDVRKGRGSRKRLTRFASSDWSHTDANGEASPHWLDTLRMKEGLSHRRTTIRSSVLSWLQDSDKTKMMKYERTRDDSSLPSSATNSGSTCFTDTFLSDLTTVGHLHEIAEEIEEEDEVPTPDSFDDIASFGKFLLSAAQKQPEAALTRISSAGSQVDL